MDTVSAAHLSAVAYKPAFQCVIDFGCTPGCTCFSAKWSSKKQKCGLFQGFRAWHCSRFEGQSHRAWRKGQSGASRRGATWFAWGLLNHLL